MQISNTNRILLADSDRSHMSMIRDYLGDQGHEVKGANDGGQALEMLAGNLFQLVITELELPDTSGLAILDSVLEQDVVTPVIFTAKSGSVERAVEAMRRGAFDFQEKPVNLDHLGFTVKRALEKASLHHAYYYLRHEQPYLYRLASIIAESPGMQNVLRQVTRVAPTNMTVMLTGETGTGKSLIAGAIHANSPRREGTLVTVNCAALTETLLESELFGHEKGAFTGAHKARAGRFQQAHGGTLFLDEVGEMSPAIQAKVLRAIEEQVIYRLGGSREIHVNVRILAATNLDLNQAVEEGRFRRDLYYRLNVAPLHIPPLKDRVEDILPLAERFMRSICAEMNRSPLQMNSEVRQAILSYPWPGNVRELRNVIERAALFSDGDHIRLADLGVCGNVLDEGSPLASPAVASPPQKGEFVAQTLNLNQLEEQAVTEALRRCSWVQKKAAGLLGITESRMTYKLNKLGITHPKFRAKRRRV